MVEDVAKSSVTDDLINKSKVRPGDEDDDLEEGELIDEGGDASSSSVPAAITTQHPLEHSWTFWFDNPSAKSRQAAWGSSIRSIYTFSTVEEFWSLYNNIHRPSKLINGADIHCFKNKIEPKWEDPICANGGKWTMTFVKQKSDQSWLYTLLAMIGEQFDHGDEICGAVVNVRARQEKIALWTRNAADESAQLSIGRQWKELLDYNESIGFIFHDEARKLDRNAKNRLYNNIHRPSKLSKLVNGADLHCFKNKIEPKWEDPICANGGTWTMTFGKQKSDQSWLYTLLAMIGEQFDHRDEICGAVVNVRPRQERIALWTMNAADESAQLSIGRQWKELLDYNESIGFIVHDEAKRLEKNAKNRYNV